MRIIVTALIALSAMACAERCAPSSEPTNPPVPVVIAPEVPDLISGEERLALLETSKQIFGLLPEPGPDSEELVALGKKLYFDTRLSVNGTQSCNSCHDITGGRLGADTTPTSVGALGEMGERNSPTVVNAGLHIAQFWDGRVATLAEQAKGPILHPKEMAMPNIQAVLDVLSSDAEYTRLFMEGFPGDQDPITYDHIGIAIAVFERGLVSRDRFDDFMGGDAGALADREVAGLKVFIEKGCTACHSGPVIGGRSYAKIGVFAPYRPVLGDGAEIDMGRYNVTGREPDREFFKVPGLRNVTATSPYFHDGRVETIEDAVRLMGELQLGQDLTTEEVTLIVEWLGSLKGVIAY